MTDAEMDRLIADHAPVLAEGKLAPGDANRADPAVASRHARQEEKYAWLYSELWAAAQECNRLFFCVDIAGVEANIQLARYDSSDHGFYDWHTDFAGYRPLRKISVSIQLSRPEDYDGGDLELQYLQPQKLDKSRGASSCSRASCCIALRP